MGADRSLTLEKMVAALRRGSRSECRWETDLKFFELL
jgi:hypothetical protein